MTSGGLSRSSVYVVIAVYRVAVLIPSVGLDQASLYL